MKSTMKQSVASFSRGLKQRTGLRVAALSLTLTALVAAGLFAGLRGSSAQSGGSSPDYSKVADFTYGATHLLRNDDLVMSFYFTRASEGRNVLFTAGTNDSVPTVINFDQPVVPNGTADCSDSAGCYFDHHAYAQANPVMGRFFNTDRDWVIHYPFQFDNSKEPYLVAMSGEASDAGATPGAKFTWKNATKVDFVIGANAFPAAVADFNQDGYDDLLMGYYKESVSPSNTKLRIAYATKPDDPSQGFSFGPEFSVPNGFEIRDMAIGDFDGDKQPEIATLYIALDKKLYVQTLGVAKDLTISKTNGNDAYIADVMTTAGYIPISMTAGQFTTLAHKQLVVAFAPAGSSAAQVSVIDFDAGAIKPKLVSTLMTDDVNADGSSIVKVKAGRFNPQTPYDQVAYMASSNSGTQLCVLTVDRVTLKASKSATSSLNDNDLGANVVFGRDIAVGNFDHRNAKDERDASLQIAVIGIRLTDSNRTAGLWTVNVAPDLTSLTQAHYATMGAEFFGGQSITEMTIVAGDLRGRSFRLGAPYKITVDQVQPTVVLAVPPMHADYISPERGQMATVLNLSIVPDGFNAIYEQTESTDSSVTDTQTTSSSFAGEEKLSGSFAFGEAGADGEIESGIEIKDSFDAKQDLKNSNDTINGAFNSQQIDVSQTTGLSDVVWFKDTSYYLYVYPVIGQKICPANKADKNGNCANSDKVPMQVMFSAPKAATIQRLASDTLEWYQPPWEYGNIFSYPAGLPQLKQYLPTIQLLTADTSVFATDDASATLKTTWSNGKTTGQNIESEKLFTEENDLSVQGKAGGEGAGFALKASAGLELNFGGSNGTKSLNESTTKFSSARGITINKSASFTTPFSYKYFFSPYIFGQIKPVGYTDTVNSTADLLAYGAVRSAYAVDPIGTTATKVGAWWAQSDYQKYPDVAINHPNRWSWGAQSKPSSGVIPSHCVGINQFTMECVSPTERVPENPMDDPFHDMRGLFITNASNPPSTNALMAPGAQLETATAGDKLKLWARVYNYSFKALPAGTKVKVRFYGMQLAADNTPINSGGSDSLLIGETVLDPIAPFAQTIANPDGTTGPAPVNWVLANTTFDTTGRENQTLAFWVAVWLEDASGKLVQELPGHGLTGIPASGATTFNAVAALEEMVDNPLRVSVDDPAQLSFSNNIGFYGSAFSILAKNAPTALLGAARAGDVKLEKVEVSGTRLKPGRSVIGSVTLRNSAQDLYGVMVYFYDGDPAQGGKLIDIERVARLRASGLQKVSINFRPQACGSHQLFVRVAPGKEHATSAQATQLVQVDCPTPVCIAQVCMKSPQYYALNLNRLPHGLVSVSGGPLNSQVSTGDTKRLGLLLQGGVSRQQQLNRQFVATQLSLLAQAAGTQTALQSNLLCYRLNFQPVQLSNGQTLHPAMTLGELFAQVRQAGPAGNAIDQRLLTNLLELLNGNDPLGRCR